LHEGIIKFKQDRVYVSDNKLKLIVLKEIYNNPLVARRGEKSPMHLVFKKFIGPR